MFPCEPSGIEKNDDSASAWLFEIAATFPAR
jgi:hypothetical protein